jgi:hypothetical protein
MDDDEDTLPGSPLESGELHEIEADDVIDTPDGGAIVRLDDEDEDDSPSEFDANLAESIEEPEMARLSNTLLELIERDIEARKKRDEQYAEGLKRTGLSGEAPGGADFEGASKVVHPVLVEACIDFAARAMKELFPSGGPVKDSVEGRITTKKIEKANRKTRLMNWQLTKQCRDFRGELEQAMTQVPLGGAQYLKLSWDVQRNRPISLFVSIDDLILPYAASNFYTSQRKTHRQYLTRLEYEQRVASGMYRDLDLTDPSMFLDQSESASVSDRIEGREASVFNEDGLRCVYECYVTMEIEGSGDEGPRPYIVSIDLPTKRVLAIYRNWDEEDESKEDLQFFVEFPFIPWRGAYAIGLPHMIGGLTGAATGALRALLDSAHIQNTPAGLKLKGAKIGGQSRSPRPGEVLQVEGGLNVDDVRKVFMPVPTNGPSPVLYELLGFLVDSAKGVVRTSVEDITDPGPNTPVGTTLARIEQGLTVYSSIHGRLHDAMDRLLGILHRLNAKYLDDDDVEREVGKDMAKREDFQGPRDVTPVSDPNVYSDAQRFAQVQAVSQRAALLPQLYNLRKVEERVLQTLKIADPDSLLNPDTQPSEQNAVNENVMASLGKAITAFPEQNHLAHLQTHVAFIVNPMFGGNPAIQAGLAPIMLQHIKEHLLWAYASGVFDECNEALGEDVGDLMKDMAENKDREGRKKVDAMLAEANVLSMGSLQQQMATILQVIQHLQQVAQQAQQSQMQQMAQMAQADPRLALQSQSDNLRHQEAMGRLQQDAAKAQQEAQSDLAEMQQKQALAAQHEQAETARTQAKIQADLLKNREDNETAMTIASAEIATGEHTALSTGTSLGEGM